MVRKVDPAVLAAIEQASPPQPAFLLPFLRLFVFHVYFLLTSLVVIPLFLLRSLVPAWRLNRNWSVATATYVLVLRRIVRNVMRFQVQPIAARKGGLRDRNSLFAGFVNALNMSGPGGSVVLDAKHVQSLKLESQTGRVDKVWLHPAGPEYLDGILSIKTSAARKIVANEYEGPALLDAKWAKWDIRAFWFTHKPHTLPPQVGGPKPERPVMLYLHGGAGVTFNAGDRFMGQNLAGNLARGVGIDLFSLDYNLAPFAPCPVHLYQALSGYLYLLNELNYSPEQIYIGGDSHGGFLTLQLERYLRLYKEIIYAGPAQIPGLLLLSPWLAPDDLSFESRVTNVRQDIINMDFEAWALRDNAYRSLPFPLSDPWITAVSKSDRELAAMPPVFLANGGVEAFVDEGQFFVNMLRKAHNLPTPETPHRVELSADELHSRIVHHVYPDAVHDYFTVDTELGKARTTYAQIGTWLNFTKTLL